MAQINDIVLEKIRDFIAALPGHGIRAQAVYLFGSHAKGTQKRKTRNRRARLRAF